MPMHAGGQEWFDFRIAFQNWEVSYSKAALESERRLVETDVPCVCYRTRKPSLVEEPKEEEEEREGYLNHTIYDQLTA